jgi:hypothetical protein
MKITYIIDPEKIGSWQDAFAPAIEAGVEMGADVGSSKLSIFGEFTKINKMILDSCAVNLQNGYPVSYRSAKLVYMNVEISAGEDVRKQTVIDICLRQEPRIDLYMREYFYNRVRERLQKVVDIGLITQEEYNWLDSIIPIEV